MKKLFLWWVGLMMLGGEVVLAQPIGQKVLHVKRTIDPIVLDGSMDEATWS